VQPSVDAPPVRRSLLPTKKKDRLTARAVAAEEIVIVAGSGAETGGSALPRWLVAG
jgi:hypothetical protein